MIKYNFDLLTLLITRFPPRKSHSSFGVETGDTFRRDDEDPNDIPDIFLKAKSIY